MEKSIETIWKQGFLESDSLVAPKLNNLYAQKSKTIISKLKRMMKINLYAIVILAFFNVWMFAALGTPYAGLFVFVLLAGVFWMSIKRARTMETIDMGLSSYDYLNSFNDWLKKAISKTAEVMRFFYPLIFLASLAPLVHALKEGEVTKNAILNSGLHLTYGIPTVAWIVSLAIAIVIYIFGGKIYRWDVNIVYKRTFKKLESLLSEMEELRA